MSNFFLFRPSLGDCCRPTVGLALVIVEASRHSEAMIPIVVDPRHSAIALIGRGQAALRRLEVLRAGDAEPTVFSDAPLPELARLAGDRLRRRLPDAAELASFDLLWIADLPVALAAPLARAAKAGGCLVNVEDVVAFCDFHNPSQVRRGDLLLTVSTAGKSPGLAARIRAQLAQTFGPEWADRLERIGGQRKAWRREARSLEELARLTNAAIDAKGWLSRAIAP